MGRPWMRRKTLRGALPTMWKAPRMMAYQLHGSAPSGSRPASALAWGSKRSSVMGVRGQLAAAARESLSETAAFARSMDSWFHASDRAFA